MKNLHLIKQKVTKQDLVGALLGIPLIVLSFFWPWKITLPDVTSAFSLIACLIFALIYGRMDLTDKKKKQVLDIVFFIFILGWLFVFE